MKIATVTLNPAIDQAVRVDHFRLNTVNYAQAMQFDAGGKGVNIASALADVGYDVAVTGFLGQENAGIFEQFFSNKHIDDQFVRIPGRTRIGVKIVDEANQQTTDIKRTEPIRLRPARHGIFAWGDHPCRSQPPCP